MKLYTAGVAPNPRRVTIFLNEKGIEVPTANIDLAKSENLLPDFLTINPFGRVPVLELDDGAYLAESVAICRYFEELQPKPPLFGVDGRDKAFVEMWNRRMEFELMAHMTGCFRHTHPYWEGRIEQFKEYGEGCRKMAYGRMKWLDGELASRPFIAGERFTVADITAVTAIDIGKVPKIRIPDDHKNLLRWYGEVSARPSVAATKPKRG